MTDVWERVQTAPSNRSVTKRYEEAVPENILPVRDAGSFRDPSGFVCHWEGEVYRVIDAPCAQIIRSVEASGLLDRLVDREMVVASRFVAQDASAYKPLRQVAPAFETFLHHEKISFISYPYEWTSTMLADAGILCLDLQLELMDAGLGLKDATPFNVQFKGVKPIGIDLSSIEQPRRCDLWIALDQFYRMFLFPLLLRAHLGWDLRGYFLSHLDGIPLDEVCRHLGPRSWLRPGLWFDVFLPFQLQRWFNHQAKQFMGSKRQQQDAVFRQKDPKLRQKSRKRALEINLQRLRRKLVALRKRSTPSSYWLGYAANNSYESEEDLRKRRFIESFLDRHDITQVLDMGCNTGSFSELAAKRGIPVVAVDADQACVDALYRKARHSGLSILPLCVDIAQPTPGMGFLNQERTPFLQRGPFDCVFALALIHHLLVTYRLPLESIRELFFRLTSRYLLLEWVGPEDPMFRTLLGAREDLYSHLDTRSLVRCFSSQFEPVASETITPHRTLLLFQKYGY